MPRDRGGEGGRAIEEPENHAPQRNPLREPPRDSGATQSQNRDRDGKSSACGHHRHDRSDSEHAQIENAVHPRRHRRENDQRQSAATREAVCGAYPEGPVSQSAK